MRANCDEDEHHSAYIHLYLVSLNKTAVENGTLEWVKQSMYELTVDAEAIYVAKLPLEAMQAR